MGSSIVPLVSLLRTTRIGLVPDSVYYLFLTSECGSQFINEVQIRRLMPTDELEIFRYKNAENLLRVRAENP